MDILKTLLARLAGAPPPVDRAHRSCTSRQRDGAEGEAVARRHLEAAGLACLATNVVYRDGELDLVMRERAADGSAGTMVFVEVRRRAGDGFGGAGGSITGDKRRRVVAAAAHYLVELGVRRLPPCRFDVVTITGGRFAGFRIEWIRDAFRDER